MSYVAKLKLLAPEFATEADARLEQFITWAQTSVNARVFTGGKYELAVCLLAAHMLTSSDRGGAGGPLTSEKVGDLSRSFGSSTLKGDEQYESTSYGQQFVRLKRTTLRTPVIL